MTGRLNTVDFLLFQPRKPFDKPSTRSTGPRKPQSSPQTSLMLHDSSGGRRGDLSSASACGSGGFALQTMLQPFIN